MIYTYIVISEMWNTLHNSNTIGPSTHWDVDNTDQDIN